MLKSDMDRQKVIEISLIAILTGLCLMWGVKAKVLDVNPRWDMISYIHMAESPKGFMEVPGHQGQRVLGPWVAGLLHHFTGLSMATSFRILAILALALLPILMFRVLRPSGVGLWETFVIAFLVLAADWPMRYSLGNVYQLTDAWTYPWILILVLASRGKNALIFFTFGLAAVLTRQNLLILVVGLYAERLLREKRWLEILPLAIILTSFGMVGKLAGSHIGATPEDARSGIFMLYHHTLRYFVGDQGAILHNFWDAFRVVPAWAPLLPLAVGCLIPEVWKAALRHPALALFAVITFLQPMIAFDMTGPDNARRLMMQGGFVLMLAGGWAIAHRIQAGPKVLDWAFLGIPVVIVTLYLISKPLALSDQARIVVGIFLLVLTLLTFVWKVRRTVRL